MRTVTTFSYEHHRQDLGRWIEWRPGDRQWETLDQAKDIAKRSRHQTRLIQIDHMVDSPSDTSMRATGAAKD